MVRVRASQHFKVKTDHRGIIPSLLLKLFSRFSANRWQKLNFCVLNRYTVTKLCILDSGKKNKYCGQKTKKNGFWVWDVSHCNTVAPRDPISSQDYFWGHYVTHIFGAVYNFLTFKNEVTFFIYWPIFLPYNFISQCNAAQRAHNSCCGRLWFRCFILIALR